MVYNMNCMAPFIFHQLLEQRKLSDVTMAMADDTINVSHDFNIPEKPRRKKRHFKLVKCDGIMFIVSLLGHLIM